MLKQLVIKNIAIIDSLELTLQGGLTVITGESGSGKSILLDAISLALGDRVLPKSIIRHGCQRGQVELLFDISGLQNGETFRIWLREQGLSLMPEETEILISRELTVGGSRARINGTPVTREVLSQLRPWLIDLHGQHELTGLFQKEQQRNYLDAFGGTHAGEAFNRLKQQVRESYQEWFSCKRAWEQLHLKQQERERQQDFLQFQCSELENANLGDPNEDTQARSELSLLSHAEKLIQVTQLCQAMIQEGSSQTPALMDQINLLQKKLGEAVQYDTTLEGLFEKLQSLSLELREISGILADYPERVSIQPERLSALTERMDQLEKLKRKYALSLPDLIHRRNELVEELNALQVMDEQLDHLQAEMIRTEKTLLLVCEQLSQKRQEQAGLLKVQLLKQLRLLAMPSVAVDIVLSPVAYSAEGIDVVEFLFSANPGEPLKPLAKVASGGELSRFLLAMKGLIAGSDGRRTLLFDEIDSGISGTTAKQVADQLVRLSQTVQVIAITHQPMIAALGRQHFHVEKQVIRKDNAEEAVQVEVEALEKDETRRFNVLARLMSGTEITDTGLHRMIKQLSNS